MEVLPATEDMFDDIHAVLREFGSNRFEEKDWRELIAYRWPIEEDYRGWVLADHGKVVGFLGAIFSARARAGRQEKFCKLTSWIVKRDFRHGSLQLVRPLRGLDDYTLVNFSPSKVAAAAFERLGFRELETEVVVIPPRVPRWSSRAGELLTRPDEILSALSAEDAQSYRDHERYNCVQLVVRQGDEYCYLVASPTKLRRWKAAFVHHLSRPAVFAAKLNLVQRALVRSLGTRLTLVDRRLLGGERLAWCYGHRLMQPRLYRPSAQRCPERSRIDSLYSECVLLDSARWTYNY